MRLLVKERLGMQIDLGWWIVGPSTVAGVLLRSRYITDLLIGPLVGHITDSRGRSQLVGGLAVVGTYTAVAVVGAIAVALYLYRHSQYK